MNVDRQVQSAARAGPCVSRSQRPARPAHPRDPRLRCPRASFGRLGIVPLHRRVQLLGALLARLFGLLELLGVGIARALGGLIDLAGFDKFLGFAVLALGGFAIAFALVGGLLAHGAPPVGVSGNARTYSRGSYPKSSSRTGEIPAARLWYEVGGPGPAARRGRIQQESRRRGPRGQDCPDERCVAIRTDTRSLIGHPSLPGGARRNLNLCTVAEPPFITWRPSRQRRGQ